MGVLAWVTLTVPDFALIVVLFILLINVGTAFVN
ncbi:YjcZ family sporulation protein [Pseudalkalibacillus sp. Hm43]